MDLRSLPTRNLVVYARPGCFAPQTRAILGRLGCQIMTAEEFDVDVRASAAGAVEPDLYLADGPGLFELKDAGDRPVVLLASEATPRVPDPRIVAAVRAPAGMHDLYRVVQQILEDNPRGTPRVATDLEAVCRREGRAWNGEVLSLSENGCLLRSEEPLPLGSEVRVAFQLPEIGRLNVRAETAYELKSCLGLVFSSTSAQIREAIGAFIERTLLELDPATPLATG